MIFSNNESKFKFSIPLIWLLFIIYGSFIPFRIRSISLIDALYQFKHIPFLDLEITSRSDWVANILLYTPLGFFLLGWISKKANSFYKKGLAFFTVFLFCILTATSVEFFQIFISPRTVSLNDLIAETLGSLFGILLWFFSGPKIINLWFSAKSNSRAEVALNAFFFLYVVSLLGITLFPFDFLVSAQEMKWKYEAWKMQSFLLNVNVSTVFIIKTMVEAAIFTPIGGLIGLKFRHTNVKIVLFLTILASFSIGFLIELLQFFTASGVSQGFSVLVRISGAFIGLAIVKSSFLNYWEWFRPYVRYLILMIFPIYFVLILKLSGWSKNGWLTIHESFSTFDFHMLLPFYFHYFSTETRAVLSLLLNFGIYIPVGFSCWLVYFSNNGYKKRYIVVSVFISMVLSLFTETGKLFQKGLHPDFTNVLIAAVSAFIVFKLSDRLFSVLYDVFNE
ncbi:VanZ family protein [Desulfobacula sp.]|uniref:VanZ family protein n=1 Tax=Desulfobacula sp. TaxID=2593537 RepID=UPI002626C25D|nr:VanZ family protein [Desulfobacula sp.]